jgi:phosphatidylglycerophosphate synthase
MPPFTHAQRIHTALTASFEKRLLIWLAHYTSARINPDHLTLLAFLAQILAGACYALAAHTPRALLLVNIFIFFNWLGDSLDGTLARVRNQQRPRYGFYVDHIVDTLGAFALIIGLGYSGFVHWQIAVALLLGFYILSIESYLATYTIGQFHISQGFFGPTELRILLIIGNFFLLKHKYANLPGHYHFLLFDVGGVVAVIGMFLMALIAVARHTLTLYRAEPLP